jgi:hypothetical protein
MYYTWVHQAYPGWEFLSFEGELISSTDEGTILKKGTHIAYRWGRDICTIQSKSDITLEAHPRDINTGEIVVLNMMKPYPQIKLEILINIELESRKAILYQEFLKQKENEKKVQQGSEEKL